MSVDILVIEDESSLVRLLSTALTAQGYVVTTAMSGN